jgi:hypothetical protein
MTRERISKKKEKERVKEIESGERESEWVKGIGKSREERERV